MSTRSSERRRAHARLLLRVEWDSTAAPTLQEPTPSGIQGDATQCNARIFWILRAVARRGSYAYGTACIGALQRRQLSARLYIVWLNGSELQLLDVFEAVRHLAAER